MGRGVYESNFNEKGSTFIVDRVIYDLDESYEDFVAEFGEDSAPTQAQYAEDEYSHLYEDFIQVIQQGAKRFFTEVQKHLDKEGAKLPELGGDVDGWADFDSSFRSVYDFNNEIQVGIKEWETDYVVGVSMTKDPLDEDPMTIILEHGLCAEDYKQQQRMKADALAVYLRYHVAENGFEPRYKTSGYTTSSYSTENAEAEKRKAVEDFADLHLASARPAMDILAENFWRNREKATARLLAEDLLFKGEWNYNADRQHVNYVVYDTKSDQVVLLDGDYEVVNETGIEIKDPQRLLLADPDLGYDVLDLNKRDNVELLVKIQRDLNDKILITPQAFELAFGREFFDEIHGSTPQPKL